MTFLSRRAAAVAVAALFPLMAAAQQPAQQGPPPQGGRGVIRGMAPARQMPNRPQLTDQQREQLRTFDEQHRQTLEAARRELGDLNRQLDDALTGAEIDTGKVNNLRASIVQKETALAQARVDRLAKLSSILTAEQRQAFRGRGLGQLFGPGGGRGGVIAGRGGVMTGPAGRGGGRGAVMARPGVQRGLRGGAAQGRAGAVIQRRQLRERLDDTRLRAEIRRLEAQIEALRRRIR